MKPPWSGFGKSLGKCVQDISLTVAPPCYDHPDYIRAMTANAAECLQPDYDHLLFSFHGLPESHLRESDPTGSHCLTRPDCCGEGCPALATCYRAQCFRTVEAFVRMASIPKDKHSIAFQSRLGREPWLKPHTDVVLEELARAGIRKLVVICPSFVSDCLETLEEIGIRGRESFLAAGGVELTLIPCLNTHPLWIAALDNRVKTWLDGLAPRRFSPAMPTIEPQSGS